MQEEVIGGREKQVSEKLNKRHYEMCNKKINRNSVYCYRSCAQQPYTKSTSKYFFKQKQK